MPVCLKQVQQPVPAVLGAQEFATEPMKAALAFAKEDEERR